MRETSEQSSVLRDFWPKLARNLAHLPFAEDAIAAWYCAFDARTPARVKGMLIAALAYFILPFDVIPDVLLGLGFTDDLAVLATAIGMVRGHITDDHRARARDALAKLKAGQAVHS